MAAPKRFQQGRALDIQENIAAWLPSETAVLETHTYLANIYIQNVPGFDGPGLADRIRALRPEAEQIALAELSAMTHTRPVFCTSEYISMLSIMLEAAPKSAMTASDITSPTGLMVFEEAGSIDVGGGAPFLERVRAFSWAVIPNDRPSYTSLLIRSWTEQRRMPATPVVPGQFKMYPGPMAILNINPETSIDASDDHIYTRILQSHFALMKSPLTLEESASRNPKTNPRTKRSLGDSLRRVYLRHPEYATYEVDEAAAAREGRAPMRAHWVRGHWRNQHYSRTSENRWIWIDGYIKGNPENGTVSTRTIGVARATPSEVRELTHAS